MSKTGVKIGALAVAVFCAFLMCAGIPVNSVASSSAELKAAPNQTDNYFHVGMQDEPKSLNPVIPNDVWSSNFLGWMWEGTLSRDPDDQSLQPWIAMDWHMDSADNRNFTVTYRFDKWDPNNEIKFHDGHHVDIYDLLFTYALAIKVPRWSSGYDSLDKTPNGTVATVNDPTATSIPMVKGIWMDPDPVKKMWTLHFRLNRTDASWELNYVSMVLYPSHLWGKKFSDGAFNTWNIEQESDPGKWVVGSGAFKFNTWVKGSQYAQLDTYQEYFPWNKMPTDAQGNKPALKDGATVWHWETKTSPVQIDPTQTPWGQRSAKPNIAGFKFHIYYSVDTAILALQNGEVDANWWTVDPGYISKLQSNSDIGMVSSEDTGFFYMAFNMRKSSFGYDDWNSANRVDKGKAFRQAATMCTDKDTIVKRLLMNYGSPGTSTISPSNTEWHNPNVKTYPYDPAGAEKILDDAGMTVGSSGWRNLGGDIGEGEFELIHPTKDYDSIRYEAARMVVEQLRAIKVHVTSKPLQFGQIVERMNARSFDCYILGWRLGLEPDYMFDFFHSSTAGPGLNNHPGYHNDYYDALVEKSRAELDRSERRDQIKEAQAIIAEDVPYNVLYYRSNVEAYRQDRWSGWVKTTGGIMNGWSFSFLKKPTEYMNILLETPNAMTESQSYSLNVKLTSSKTSLPTAGATVTMLIKTSGGKSPGTLAKDTATSDANGIATFSYTAPAVNATEYNRTITYEITATKTDMDASKGFGMSVIYTGTVVYHTATIDAASSVLTVKEGETGTVRVLVKDQKKAAASGVNVKISAEPSTGITFKASSVTTDSSGRATFTFTGEAKGNYTVSAMPDKGAGVFAVFGASSTANVIEDTGEGGDSGGLPMMVIIAIVVVLVVVIAVVAVVVMKKKNQAL